MNFNKISDATWEKMSNEEKVAAVETATPEELKDFSDAGLASGLSFHTLSVLFSGWRCPANIFNYATEWNRRYPSYDGTKQWARAAHKAASAILGQMPKGNFGPAHRAEVTQ